MKFLVLCLLLAPAVLGASVEIEKCAWGESYWCSELSVAKTCGAIQHCKTTVWKNQKLTLDSSEVCEFCQTIVDDVRKFITSKKTEDDISQFLSTACAIIPNPNTASECKTIVENFTPEIIDLIVSANVSSQQLCRLIHLCTGVEDTVKHASVVAHSQPIRVPLHKDNDVVVDTKLCNDCKAFFGDIVEQITSNVTMNELEDLLNQEVCAQLGSFKDECNELIKEFLPLAMQYVQHFMDPNVVCQSMGFCTPASQQARILIDFLKTTPVLDSLRKVPFEGVESCLICKAVFTESRAVMRDATTQTVLTNFVKNDVCANLGSFKPTCIAMVDAYARQAFEFIVTVLDPDTRCTSFGFCQADAPTEGNTATVVRDATPHNAKSSAPAECILCEYIMKEIETLLQDNKTEAEILAALDKVCYILPSTIRASCVDFINTYGQAVLSILETEVTPAEVCSLLGLCKSQSPAEGLKEKSKLTAGDAETCLICETVVQYVETLIKDNSTIVEVEEIVKKVCNFLPDTMKTECDSIIDQYGSLIVQYIISKYDPKEVCTLVKLCDSAKTMRMVNLVAAKPHRVVAGNCSNGPAYWCSSLHNAEECGAVEHCKKYVWSSK